MNCRDMPAEFDELKYGCVMHGVGLCDEWPLVAYPDQEVPGAFDYALEPGMVNPLPKPAKIVPLS